MSWGDWLGTGFIAVRNRHYRPFEEARFCVWRLGFRKKDEWDAWADTTARPSDIPAAPYGAYKGKGWLSWPDWLGTRRSHGHRPFERARSFVRTLDLKNKEEWDAFAQTDARPHDIPVDPRQAYKDEGWNGYGDWLGTGYIAHQKRIARPLVEAREYVRSLGLTSQGEWNAWARSDERPSDIPFNPDKAYRDEDWQGYADWLGVVNRWNRNAIISFLRSLMPILPSLDPVELYALMRQNGLLIASRERTNANRELITNIVRLTSVANPEVLVASIADELRETTAATVSEDGAGLGALINLDDAEVSEPVTPPHQGAQDELPSLDATDILRAVDQIVSLSPTTDQEAVEFFIAKAVGKLWREKLTNQDSVDPRSILSYPAGEYAGIVRSRFLAQLDGAEGLSLPQGYRFHVQGEIRQPNLMQRLIAYRLREEKRLGNWSGTGAGKTMGAILASRVVTAHLTVIVALNNTLDGWMQEILNTFPDSTVIIKERGSLTIDHHAHTYLLLNFEAFQQPDSPSMVRRLVGEHRIDMVVLDEVQSVKQRGAVASKRRQVLGGLLSLAAERNPDLYVLGMSATPVVNNLTEAVSLLEMILGIRYPELGTRPTIPNAIAVHEKLVTSGVRYKPEYALALTEQRVEVPGDGVIDALRKVGKGNVLGMEQVLLAAKLSTIVAHTRPGTLIYSHYVEQIVFPLRQALADAGFRVAEFTGEDKSGIERFKRREADVLIGSSTLGTGVDGLQYVCNRLIVATLPWTSAGYEQLIGRLYRQGSAFDHVDVIIPQVVLGNGEEMWSWDVQRRDRILYKKTLADATVDGAIPEGVLESESVMLSRALESLQAWINRLEEGDTLRVAQRERLMIPLPEDERRRRVRAFGDFAAMNARFNNAHSSTSHARLSTDPSEWYLYHTLYREARKTWPEVPYESFTTWLQARPHLVAGDFGCGEALLAASAQNTVYSFDHVAINDKIIMCDMAHTGLDAEILDVAIFSLSLMGTNIEDYLREAHRLLKLDGRLKIAEPAGHWEGAKREALITMMASLGFQLIGSIQERGSFIHIDALKV